MESKKSIDISQVKCRECGKGYDTIRLGKSLGKESAPYLLGLCSASCYTKYVQKNWYSTGVNKN